MSLCGGGGSFFLTCNIPFPDIFFLNWSSACAHKFRSLGQDQSTVAEQAEMTVGKRSLMSFVSAPFPGRFPNYAWTA